MNALRVLHVVESLHPGAGRIGLLLPGLFEGLERVNVHSTCFAIDSWMATGSDVEHDRPKSTIDKPRGDGRAGTGEPCRVPDLATGPRDRRSWRDLFSSINLVHVHGWGSPAHWDLARRAAQLRIPFVVSPLGDLTSESNRMLAWSERWRKRWRGDRLVRRASAILVQNSWEAEHLCPSLRGAPVQVLPYGIDADSLNSMAIDESSHSQSTSPESVENLPATASVGGCDNPGDRQVFEPTLLLLAPIHPAEGIVSFLKAFAEVASDRQDGRVVMAGEEVGPWRRQIEAAVRRKGGENRVTFVQAESEGDQVRLLRSATVLVSPTLWTRCPASILQGLVHGIPVVASESVVPEGLKEAVRCITMTRSSLRDAIRWSLEEAVVRPADLVERGRRLVNERGSWTALTGRYVETYRRLI